MAAGLLNVKALPFSVGSVQTKHQEGEKEAKVSTSPFWAWHWTQEDETYREHTRK
jgi:hypothetical protein